MALNPQNTKETQVRNYPWSRLEWYECLMAAHSGISMRIESIRKGLKDKAEMEPGERWLYEIEGRGSELALAKHFKLYWGGNINTFKRDGDVFGMEVRNTIHHEGGLLLRDGDEPNRIYFLTIGMMPDYEIVGWMWGYDVMLEKNRKAINKRKPDPFLIPHNDPRINRDLAEGLKLARMRNKK